MNWIVGNKLMDLIGLKLGGQKSNWASHNMGLVGYHVHTSHVMKFCAGLSRHEGLGWA